jgi:hypothetical protein
VRAMGVMYIAVAETALRANNNNCKKIEAKTSVVTTTIEVLKVV